MLDLNGQNVKQRKCFTHKSVLTSSTQNNLFATCCFEAFNLSSFYFMNIKYIGNIFNGKDILFIINILC